MNKNVINTLVLNHNDPDGYCAGAIVNYFESKNGLKVVQCCKMNYGYNIPWGKIKRAKQVYMVDFSLPVEDMVKIQSIVGYENFIWIDHHKTVIEDVEKSGRKFKGLREIGKSGCELTWIWFNYDKPMPKGVRVIGRYDVWDIKYHHEGEGIYAEDIFPFIQGIKYYEADGNDLRFWSQLFLDTGFYNTILDQGRLLYDYQCRMYERYCRSHSFEMEWEGLRFLVVNALNCNSQMFDSMFDNHKHDAVMTYGYTNRNWSVSMYTDKEGIDVGALAHKYGGGGHKNAAGVNFDKELPFQHLLQWKDE